MTDTVSRQMAGKDILPEGWTWGTAGELALEINPGFPSGKHNQTGAGTPHLRPMNINAKGEIDMSVVKYVEADSYNPLTKGDVLFNNTNSPALLGKTALITRSEKWAYSNHMTRLRPDVRLVEPAWLAYGLHKLFYEGFYRLHCRNHVNQASIGKAFLSDEVRIPLPPLNEQRRIVEKIEELFTRLDAGVEALKKAQALLKKYRQSVLKAAVEGELSREWREAHKDEIEPASELLKRIMEERREKFAGKKYKEPASPDTSKLPALPEGWEWATFEQTSDRVTVGHVGPMKNEYISDGIPFLRSQNVRENKFSRNGLKFISNEFHNRLGKSSLQAGDLVVVRSGSVGTACVVPDWISEANCSDLIIVKQPRAVLSHFGAYYMNSTAKTRVAARQVGVALTHFNTKSMSAMPVPVPPLKEQRFIVEEVERRLSVVDKLEATIEANLKRANGLRQSILQQAFSGRLVPQDPNDEPASVLLERIKKERLTTNQKSKKSRGKKREANQGMSLFPESEG